MTDPEDSFRRRPILLWKVRFETVGQRADIHLTPIEHVASFFTMPEDLLEHHRMIVANGDCYDRPTLPFERKDEE